MNGYLRHIVILGVLLLGSCSELEREKPFESDPILTEVQVDRFYLAILIIQTIGYMRHFVSQ